MDKETEYFEQMYNVRDSVANHMEYFNSWAIKSREFRKSRKCRFTEEVSYGENKMETMDIFQPSGKSGALMMFVHGGYWRSLDKQDHSFLAEPFVKRGVAVAVINYSLCPQVGVDQICRQVTQAGSFLYRNADAIGFPAEKMFVVGHSAGGHLALMAVSCLWRQIDYRFPNSIFKAGLSISGLYDLRVLVRVKSVNKDLKLTNETAEKVSPALFDPPRQASVWVAVGGRETGGFKDQHRRIIQNWRGVVTKEILCPEEHHFDILEKLADPEHVLCKSAFEMLEI